MAVAQGNAEAMANIGDLYKNGKGVSKDMKQAIQWYEKAASQEKPSADALSSLSLLYRDGNDVAKDEKKAGELLEKACNLGDAQSCFYRAADYENGRDGTQKDLSKAVIFYEKASNFGDNRASEELSNAYLEGKLGLEEDIQKAFFYLERAGDRGNEKALKDLVEIYSEGVEKDEIKIPADPVKMEEWRKKAEEMKNPISHYFFIFNLRQLQN